MVVVAKQMTFKNSNTRSVVLIVKGNRLQILANNKKDVTYTKYTLPTDEGSYFCV